jgi:cytochrome c-type biogenesis protein
LAGLVSLLSPCVLPLVPGYVSLISGVGVQEVRSQESQSLRKVMLNSVGFILGFSIVFIALGAISTEVGQLLAQYKSTLARLAGVIIVIFGFHLTGLFRINALYADKRLHNVKGGSTIVGAFLVGFAFAFGWTPCVGPILAVILGFAAAQDSLLAGIVLLAVYSTGLRNTVSADCLGYRAFSQVL